MVAMNGNLYNQFVMQAPSRTDVAGRLLGRPGRVTGVSTDVHKSTAPEAFFLRAGMARTKVMNSRTYVLDNNSGMRGIPGGALNGLGGFMGFGDSTYVAGVVFKNDDAYRDLTGGVTLRGSAGTWSALPTSLLSDLTAAMSAAATTSAGQRAVDQLTQKLKDAAAVIDDKQHFDLGWGGRSDARDLEYLAAMKNFKTTVYDGIDSLNAITATAAKVKAAQAAAAGNPTDASGNSILDYMPKAPVSNTKDVGAPAASSGLPMPLIVGGIALVGLGGLFLVLRKKKG